MKISKYCYLPILFIWIFFSSCFENIQNKRKEISKITGDTTLNENRDVGSVSLREDILPVITIADSNPDTLNIVDFGAVGNGVVDNSGAIQKAINALSDNQVLVIPKGTFLVRESLIVNKSNIKIIGKGDGSIIQYQRGKFTKTKRLLYGFHLRNAANVLFANFKIIGGA